MNGTAAIDPLLQSYLAAQKAGIRRSTGLLQRQATRAAASKGLQTSGVSEIAAAPIRQERLAQEAGAEGNIAMRQFGEQITDRRLKEEYERRKNLMMLQAKLMQDVEDRRSKGSLLSAGIGGGLGLAGSLFKGGS